MRNELLSTVCVSAALLSTAASLLANVYAGIAIAVPSFVAFYLLRQRIDGDSSRTEADSTQFVGNLIENHDGHADTISLIHASLSPSFSFYRIMNEAISRYSAQGSAELSFSKLLKSDSAALSETVSAIVRRLDDGAEMIDPLKEIRRHINSENRHKMKNLGSVLNADSVVRLGSMMFFPVFAGISMRIAVFAGSSQGFAALKAGALSLIFAFYIINTNAANFGYSNTSMKFEKAALRCFGDNRLQGQLPAFHYDAIGETMEYMPYTNEMRAFMALARAAKAQGSLEYIMMLSAVSIVIVIALAMVTQLKGTAVHAFSGNGVNQSVSAKLGDELANLTNTMR